MDATKSSQLGVLGSSGGCSLNVCGAGGLRRCQFQTDVFLGRERAHWGGGLRGSTGIIKGKCCWISQQGCSCLFLFDPPPPPKKNKHRYGSVHAVYM